MRMQGKAFVDGKLACEGVVTSQMVPRNPKTGATGSAAQERLPAEAEVVA
jgi:hypothetical protein